MKPFSIAVIGTGAVGSTTAYALMLANIAPRIIIVDEQTDRCRGHMLDLADARILSTTREIIHCGIDAAHDANILILTAGLPQAAGQKRSDLRDANSKIFEKIFQKLGTLNPDTIIIVVTNPLDDMTQLAQKLSGLPRSQVFGSGTLLDTQRMRGFVSEALNISEKSVDGFVIGEHGDAQFIAWSTVRVAGKLVKELLSTEECQAIEKKTREKAYDIIELKGATYFGISACVTQICRSIIFDERKIMPVSTYHDAYGCCVSLPAILSARGVDLPCIACKLTAEEQEKLAACAKK